MNDARRRVGVIERGADGQATDGQHRSRTDPVVAVMVFLNARWRMVVMMVLLDLRPMVVAPVAIRAGAGLADQADAQARGEQGVDYPFHDEPRNGCWHEVRIASCWRACCNQMLVIVKLGEACAVRQFALSTRAPEMKKGLAVARPSVKIAGAQEGNPPSVNRRKQQATDFPMFSQPRKKIKN